MLGQPNALVSWWAPGLLPLRLSKRIAESTGACGPAWWGCRRGGERRNVRSEGARALAPAIRQCG
eukprot:1626857-Alexandrium_andersonii.AAC.1